VEAEQYSTRSTRMRVSALFQLEIRSRHSGPLHEEKPNLQWRLLLPIESSHLSKSRSIVRLLRCLSTGHHLQVPFLFHQMACRPIVISTFLLLRRILAFTSESCRPHDPSQSGVLTSEKRRV
jgi:hypothetical protein